MEALVSSQNKHALEIRPLLVEDLPAVADIHIQAFPGSALTKLGEEAVRRYYEWQILGPHDALNIGVYDGDTLLGFCFGGVFRGALGGFLEENRRYLVQRVVVHPWLLLNPLFRERVKLAVSSIYRRFRPQRTQSSPESSVPASPRVPHFGILSIAVAPQYQGHGAARLLMEYSERVAVERGFSRMGLTVHPSNGRAVRFYEKMGWQRDMMDSSWDGHMSKAIENFTPEASMENG